MGKIMGAQQGGGPSWPVFFYLFLKYVKFFEDPTLNQYFLVSFGFSARRRRKILLFFASSSLFCMFLKRFPQLSIEYFPGSQKISHSSDFFSSEYMKFSKNFTYEYTYLRIKLCGNYHYIFGLPIGYLPGHVTIIKQI